MGRPMPIYNKMKRAQIKQLISLLLTPFLAGTCNANATASEAAGAATSVAKSTGIDYQFFIAGGVCVATSHVECLDRDEGVDVDHSRLERLCVDA